MFIIAFLDSLSYLNPSLRNLFQSITIPLKKNHVGPDIVGDLFIENEKKKDREDQNAENNKEIMLPYLIIGTYIDIRNTDLGKNLSWLQN